MNAKRAEGRRGRVIDVVETTVPRPGDSRQGDAKGTSTKDHLKWWSEGRRSDGGITIADNLLWVFKSASTTPEYYFVDYSTGKRRIKKLGSVEKMTLKEAKDRAAEMRLEIKSGNDVIGKAKKDKQIEQNTRLTSVNIQTSGEFGEREIGDPLKSWTFEVLCEYFFKKEILESGNYKKKESIKRVKGRLQKYPCQYFKGVLPSQILPADVQKFMESIRYPSPRMRCFFDLVRILDLASLHMLVTQNVANNTILKNKFSNLTKKRTRYLSEKEIESLFGIIAEIGKVSKKGEPYFAVENYYAIRLLLTAGGRKSEVLQMKWADVDFEQGYMYISADRSKTRTPAKLFLSRYSMYTLRKLKELAGKSVYVFPKRRSGTKGKLHVGSDTVNRALNKTIMPIFLAQNKTREAFTVHDFRRTARTHLSSLNVSESIAERCINHVTGTGTNSNKTYDMHHFEPQMQDAFKRLGEHIMKLDYGFKLELFE